MSLSVREHSIKKPDAPFLRRLAKWSDPEYRQGYLEGSVEQTIAYQIRANRKARGLTQSELAEALHTTQSGISRLEDPEYGAQSLESLVKVAHFFDCALSVRLISYSQLAAESVDLSPEALVVKSFNDEIKAIEGELHASPD